MGVDLVKIFLYAYNSCHHDLYIYVNIYTFITSMILFTQHTANWFSTASNNVNFIKNVTTIKQFDPVDGGKFL